MYRASDSEWLIVVSAATDSDDNGPQTAELRGRHHPRERDTESADKCRGCKWNWIEFYYDMQRDAVDVASWSVSRCTEDRYVIIEK